MAKRKVSEADLQKLLEKVYKDISVEVEPRRKDFEFKGDFAEMSNRRSGPLTEYHFYKNVGDVAPFIMIWCLKKGIELPYEIFVLETEGNGKFMIESFETTYFFTPEKQTYHLNYS